MNDHKEKISALTDGELRPRDAGDSLARLLAGGEGGGGQRAVWARYHFIGGVLRGEHRHIKEGGGVAARVAEALLDEAPHRPAAVKRRRPRFALRRLRLWWWPGGALAAAAALAVALVVGDFFAPPAVTTVTKVPVRPVTPQTESALNAFLVDHGEFHGAHGLSGLMSYTRFVVHEEE
ncbi:MAG: sigma-E factor negative regulatory protein [Gammaproteobacteria bacterium]|nr:sigma-E factor negative regulatory protein [Gammaproteobacteria bacterium]